MSEDKAIAALRKIVSLGVKFDHRGDHSRRVVEIAEAALQEIQIQQTDAAEMRFERENNPATPRLDLSRLFDALTRHIPPPPGASHSLHCVGDERIVVQLNDAGKLFDYPIGKDDWMLDPLELGAQIELLHRAQISSALRAADASGARESELMLQIPVLDNFDVSKVVGYLSIAKHAVPDLPTFHFSLGFSAIRNPIRKQADWEWRAVSLLPDAKFSPLQQDDKGVHL